MIRVFAGWLYVLGGAAALVGAIIYLTSIPDVPDEDDLVVFKGYLTGIRLQKDFDATDIVYLHFRDHPQVYRYQSNYPQYVEVRDRLGIYRDVEILVEPSSLEGTADSPPQPVWGLVEHDPYRDGTVVTYDEIYEEVTATDRSWQNVALIMLGGGLGAVLLAFAIRKAVPYVPRDPSI